MTQEEIDFIYFRDYQLHSVEYTTGQLDTIRKISNQYGTDCGTQICSDVGSKNPDGYIRVWCNGKLRMRNRLIYFLYHNEIPPLANEIDHYDRIRSNDSISNLQPLTKSNNNGRAIKRSNTRFTDEDIHQMCNLLSTTNLSDQGIANAIGCSRPYIRDIKTRRRRSDIGNLYCWNHRGY